MDNTPDMNNNYTDDANKMLKSSKKKKESNTDNREEKESSVDYEKFRISGRYQLLKYVGAGSFGEIHLAFDMHQKTIVCIKFELTNQKNPQLKHEHSVLQSIHEEQLKEGFPKVYAYEKDSKSYCYMIIEFLGPSLGDLLAFCGGKFSLITTCLIALQFISRIETLHEAGYLHRDLKPENFLIGINENSHLVYLIDFGLAKRYKNVNSNGHHMAYKENKMLVGTARYASINSHLGIEISRRDDIESLVYILIYFFKGKLPWQHTSNREDREMKKIVEKKIKIAPEVLCEGLPKQFSNILHYAKNLKFEDRPDYSLLKQMMNEIFLTLVDYDKLDIYIPEYHDTNEQTNKSPIKKNKKMKYSEFIYALEHKKLNFEYNSNEIYTTSNPNIIFINKEFTFIYDWQINPNDKDVVVTKYDKKFTIQSKIQEEEFSDNQDSDEKSESSNSKTKSSISDINKLIPPKESKNSLFGKSEVNQEEEGLLD